VRARLRATRVKRFRARGASLTFLDLDLVAVKERVLTVAPIPNGENADKTKATNKPDIAERLLKVTDSVPIPGSHTYVLCTRLAKLGQALASACNASILRDLGLRVH
jgi:hypothetical protein